MSAARITVESPAHGETLIYPLAIIRGHCVSCQAHTISTSTCRHSVITSPIHLNRFTTQAFLQPGENVITLTINTQPSTTTTHILVYTPPVLKPPYVRAVYVTTNDSRGDEIQSEDPSTITPHIARRKFLTALHLCQSATAELLHHHFGLRRTFLLDPQVHIHTLSLTTPAAHALSPMQLYTHIHAVLDIPPNPDIINVAIMSFTRQTSEGLKAHTALGGEGLALFGGASLFLWPTTPSDIPTVFTDTRPIDPIKFFDDSAGRNKSLGRRACVSTTIGAVLHELGHTLSLPHPCADAAVNGGGIMMRGFDYLDRLFVQPSPDSPLPFWDRGSAVRLRYHRFIRPPLQLDNLSSQIASLHLTSHKPTHPVATPSPTPSPSPTPAQQSSADPPHDKSNNKHPANAPWFDRTGDDHIRVNSSIGLGHIAYYRDGDNAAHEEFITHHPKHFVLPPLRKLQERCHATAEHTLRISAIDINGLFTEVNYNSI